MSKSIQILPFSSLHYSRLFHQMVSGYRLSIRFGYIKLVHLDRHCNQFSFVNVSKINVYFVSMWLYTFVYYDTYVYMHLCDQNYAIRRATLSRKIIHLKFFCCA